ncbi:restriction endonuclease [Clostridium butyricum]|uniref:restriction endonuclease n=1 Tax=Clostridium butyricum TaxID=1492 RepID=UPI00129BE949|nr:restriction endonuclease [Clostridium butyricum]QGH20199.1 restriction endonuclease [Clostridium butyricum]QGH24234.1 restriction endonuclease [Clostridium butyricum]
MLSNVTNGKITNEQLLKFANLVDVISDIENNIPLSTKSVFNFKGRKSEEIAKLVIEHLTDKNSVVCDPFIGTGTFAIASSSIPRETVGIELDNYTYSVVSTLLENIDFNKLTEMFKSVKDEVFGDIMDLYTTFCCGEKNYIKTLYFDPEPQEYYHPKTHREIKDDENIKLYYKCPVCGKNSKRFDIKDDDKIKYCNNLDTSLFPSHKLIENSRINITASTGADNYDVNFTKRNKFALLKLQQCISKLDPCIERDVLEHALVSSLTLARIAQYGSGSEYIYQVMRFQAQEMNVWYLFESKYNNIVAFKREYLSSKKFSAANGKSFLTLLNGDYYKILSNSRYKEKFDLIYTDPPYTDQVPYLERNQLYRDWLYNFYDSSTFTLTKEMLEDEIVVSNAPTRSSFKDNDNYYNDLDKMFKTFYRCTKQNGVIALTLNLGKNKYFKTLSQFINKARKNGFEYVFRIDLTKKDPSLRKQAAYKNTLSTEMLVFFVKLDSSKAYWYINDSNIELEIGRLIYNLILKNKGITLTTAIKAVNTDILKTDPSGTDMVNARIKKLIQEQFIVEKQTSMVYIDPDRLYLSIEDNTTLFYKLYNITPVIINNLLETKGSFTLDDLYFDISSKLCNGDPYVLNQLLEDPLRERYIVNLIQNYCDTEKDTYVKKSISAEYSEDAIDVSVLDGYQFEEILKQLLKAEGYKDVIRLGGAGDRGVDLRAKKINPLTGQYEGYIFQSKRWIGNVGGEPIQRLHSMWMQYPDEIQHAVCITTSDYTEQGKREADNTKVQTVNGTQLMDRLNKAFPGKYYHSLLNFSI